MFIADNESDVITRLLGTAPWLTYRSSPGADKETDGTELYDTTAGGIAHDTDGIADIGIEAIWAICGCAGTVTGAYDAELFTTTVLEMGVDVELDGVAADAQTSDTAGCISDRFVS